ncbi:MAG: VCBS repeat-containing protein [Acidobacteriia bacterium]|nr:VCBS repeat-containing protein [Terriglobia bacterium]
MPDTIGSGACFFDFDGEGRPDLLLADGGGQGGLTLYRNLGNGRFSDVTQQAGFDPAFHALSCAAGDYDNDGFPDLAISGEVADGRVLVYHNERNGTFKDVTGELHITASGRVASLMWVDYDHDGDLDLYVTGSLYVSGRTASMLWRNNGNGTFTDVTAEIGLGGGGFAAVATDYNDDRAIDLLVTGSPTRIFNNPREGRWSGSEPWAAPMPATKGVAVLDYNKDGWMDLAFTHSAAPGLSLWRNVDGKRFEPVSLADLRWVRAWGVAAFDYDNDGWMDLVAVGETAPGRAEIRLLRNTGAAFVDVTAQVGLDKILLTNPRALAIADYDGDGDDDILITQAGGPPVLLRNDGGNKNSSVRVSLQGLNDNKSAIGCAWSRIWASRRAWRAPPLPTSPADCRRARGASASRPISRFTGTRFWWTGLRPEFACTQPTCRCWSSTRGFIPARRSRNTASATRPRRTIR